MTVDTDFPDNGWTASGPIVGVASEIPYRSVARVDGGGTLTVKTVQQDEIAGTGFGGLLIDSFLRSSGKAADRIRTRLPRRPDDPRQAGTGTTGPLPAPAWPRALLAMVVFALLLVVGGRLLLGCTSGG
ncbi:MAG: hypothetical protein QOF84_2180 [Streptomyces sp.]|nr:hypothetical protein [Streptomyces sp.]